MGFVSSLLGIVGFGIGLPFGLLLGFFFFIYSKPKEPEDPIVRPLYEFDTNALQDLLDGLPLWVKNPDYDRVDWLNKIISDMWPCIAKVSTGIISSAAEPTIAEYTGKFHIKEIEFESLDLGNLPPILFGLKVYETNEKELVMEAPVRWAGNPNISLAIKVLSLNITVQLVDVQVFSTARITLKPLVPSLPCFLNIVVSLMEKPHVDFGLKILGGDIMSIPGLYRFVQETIKKKIASLYLWPQTLEMPILDPSFLAIKKPVGILHVNVVRARKLLKKDFLGASDPYVKLNLTGESLPAKKTTVKKKTLNPEWNENFKLIVTDPQAQVLRLQVYDWDKVGGHDRLGTQLVPLKKLTPHERKELVLDLLKDTDINGKKTRGQIDLALTFVPFKENSLKYSGPLDVYARKDSGSDQASVDALDGAGLLSVMVQGAEEVEGQSHNNPYAAVHFRGEKKKTKMIKRTRNPIWNEEFQFMLDEPPLNEKIHVQVFSKRTGFGFSFLSKESLGQVEINLRDVIDNGRINEKYHLINSKNGTIHVEIRWTTA